MEVWQDIPGFPSYQASTNGQIRSAKSGTWKLLRVTGHPKTGYVAVSLRVNGRYITRSVHRLIALTFIGPSNGCDVNHINGDKRDNRLANLEYLTRGDNHRHAYATCLRAPVGKKLTDEQVRCIAEMRGQAIQTVIARQFGVSRSTIAFIHNRKRHQRLLQTQRA
jgi:hypothetical protein